MMERYSKLSVVWMHLHFNAVIEQVELFFWEDRSTDFILFSAVE